LFTVLFRDAIRIETRQGGDAEKTERSFKKAVGFKMP
jgi:hypothetical protein